MRVIAAVMLLGLLLCGCGPAEVKEQEPVYLNVSAEEAKRIMDTQENYIILDVRMRKEYDEGHIPGAIVIPDYDIREKAEQILTDKNQLILVYCRSGRRSKLASQELLDMGYTNIIEFGGILDWPYEIEYPHADLTAYRIFRCMGSWKRSQVS